MIVFQVPVVRVNEKEGSSLTTLNDKNFVIISENVAKRIVEQYNGNPEEVAPVKIGPNTIAVVRGLSYDEEKKCVMADVLLPFRFSGAIYPIQEVLLNNGRKLMDGKLVAVKMIPENLNTKEQSNGV